ncbi:hypothetical protein C4J81_03100 [Deltaproteobacteria bacterium Smac51]|nr:hypothetical protein C4J81_03100 [Deltaproteobacteria bacterium Smac51]
MCDVLEFSDKSSFRAWLTQNGAGSDGVWLLFGKKGGPGTLTANEALEEALCFGWIDGQIQSLDNTKYKKYFARRRAKSMWSEKNKKLAQLLIKQGRMAPEGLTAIESAKQNGAWDSSAKVRIGDGQVKEFRQLISPHEPAYANLLGMSPSVQKTYTGYYLDAKTPQARQKRLEKITDRLNKNLKPM